MLQLVFSFTESVETDVEAYLGSVKKVLFFIYSYLGGDAISRMPLLPGNVAIVIVSSRKCCKLQLLGNIAIGIV